MDSTLLQHLLEDLNDGYTVPAAEAMKSVLPHIENLRILRTIAYKHAQGIARLDIPSQGEDSFG